MMKRVLSHLSQNKQTVALVIVSLLLALSAFRLWADLRAFGNMASYTFSGLYTAFQTAANQAEDQPYEFVGTQLYEDAYTELFALDELARTSLIFRRYAPGDSLRNFISWASVEDDPAQQEKNLDCIAQIAGLLEPTWNLEPGYNYLGDPEGAAQVMEQVRELARAAYPGGASGA